MELKNHFTQDTFGNKISDASCAVYLAGTTTLATGLVNRAGNPISNPMSSGPTGLVQFAAPNGKYDLVVTKDDVQYLLEIQCNDIDDTRIVMETVRDDTESFSVDGLRYLEQTQAFTIQAQQAAIGSSSSANDALVIKQQLPSVSQFNDIQTQVNAITADPINAVTSWIIPAKNFDLIQGTPTYGPLTNRIAGWQFAQLVASYVSAVVSLPSHWGKMDVYAIWTNQVANTGNVVIGGEIHQWAIGETINTSPVGGSGIFAADASPWISKESKVAADIVVTPGKCTTLRIARQGASANDTLPNSVALIAVRLVKKP